MESKKVIHVHLKNPTPDGQQDFYFGSLRAIYSVLSVADIGRNYTSLTAKSIFKNGGFFENKRCTIRISEVIRNKRGEQGN